MRSRRRPPERVPLPWITSAGTSTASSSACRNFGFPGGCSGKARHSTATACLTGGSVSARRTSAGQSRSEVLDRLSHLFTEPGEQLRTSFDEVRESATARLCRRSWPRDLILRRRARPGHQLGRVRSHPNPGEATSAIVTTHARPDGRRPRDDRRAIELPPAAGADGFALRRPWPLSRTSVCSAHPAGRSTPTTALICLSSSSAPATDITGDLDGEAVWRHRTRTVAHRPAQLWTTRKISL